MSDARANGRWARKVAGLVALICIASPAGHAAAHATITSIVPADGTLLADPPSELRVTFSEPIQEDFIQVAFVSTDDAAMSLTGSVDPNDGRVLVVPLPPVGDGLHRISFVVRDREDLHEVRGRTSFALGDGVVAEPSPPADPGARTSETIARWIFAAGFALIVGALVCGRHVPKVRLRHIVLAGFAAVVIGRVGVLVARAADLGRGFVDGLRAVAGTGDTTRLPVAILAAACVLPLAFPDRMPLLDQPVRKGGRTSLRVTLAWVGVVWLALMAAWGDHAALLGAVEPPIAVAKAMHLGGLGLWVGVLAVLQIGVPTRAARADAIRSVSRIAVAGALLTAATGFVLAGRLVISLTGLFRTTYGEMLLAKLSIAALAVGLGLWMRRRESAAAGVAELTLLAAGVVLLGTAMATSAPATDGAYLAAATTKPALTSSAELDAVLVRARAIPAAPGPNDIEVAVVQTRRPIPAPITSVGVEVEGSDAPPFDIVPDASGNLAVPGVVLTDGITKVRFTVRREGMNDVVLEAPVRTVTPRYHAPVFISSARVRVVWWGLAALALAALTTWLWRPRRSP